jgi:hypothetical protein
LLRLQAGNEGPLQRSRNERILLGPEISLRRARPFSGLPNRRQVNERSPIAVDKILQQARHFGFGCRIFDVVNQARERKNLALAQELLRQVGFEQLDFLRQRPGQIGLLDALGIHQLVLAKLQYLAVVKPNGKRADQQKRSQNEPKDAHAPGAHTFPASFEIQRHLYYSF